MKFFNHAYRYRACNWTWGIIHILPAIEIGWGAKGIAIELKWLTFVLTVWQKDFLVKIEREFPTTNIEASQYKPPRKFSMPSDIEKAWKEEFEERERKERAADLAKPHVPNT